MEANDSTAASERKTLMDELSSSFCHSFKQLSSLLLHPPLHPYCSPHHSQFLPPSRHAATTAAPDVVRIRWPLQKQLPKRQTQLESEEQVTQGDEIQPFKWYTISNKRPCFCRLCRMHIKPLCKSWGNSSTAWFLALNHIIKQQPLKLTLKLPEMKNQTL